MKAANPYRVHLVLDPAFGRQLADLPADEPVWVVASPDNDPVVRELCQQRPSKSHLHGITVFQSYGDVPEQACLGVLGTVDLHHGEHSADPPYSILSVVGCSPSEEICAVLAELGFAVSAVTPESFSALRSVEVA